ncbi:MAG TPA: hypothetical protein VF520_05270 [Thermoleophilaceae bacterium]
MSSLDGHPVKCGEAYATPKSNYRQPEPGGSAEPEPPPKVELSIGPPRDLDTDGSRIFQVSGSSVELSGRVSPKGALVKIARAKFDSSGSGQGFAPFRRIRVTNGRLRITVPLDAKSIEYRITGSAPGYKSASDILEFEVSGGGGGSRPSAPNESGQSFSGNGGKNLGRVKVATDSVLRWTNDGDVFQIFDDEGGLFVNSQAHEGDTAVAAGTYTNVQINAIGNWTIQIQPR